MPQFPSPRFLFWTHFAVVCGDLGTLHCFAMLISTKGHLLRDKYLWKNVRRKYTVAEKLKKTQKTYKTRNIARTALVYQIPFVGHRNHRTSKSQKNDSFFLWKISILVMFISSETLYRRDSAVAWWQRVANGLETFEDFFEPVIFWKIYFHQHTYSVFTWHLKTTVKLKTCSKSGISRKLAQMSFE